MPNVSAIIPPFAERIGASVTYFVLATVGTAIYATFLLAVYRGRKQLSEHSFYNFIYHFAVADLGLITFTNFFITVPLSFTAQPLYGHGQLLHAMCFRWAFR